MGGMCLYNIGASSKIYRTLFVSVRDVYVLTENKF